MRTFRAGKLFVSLVVAGAATWLATVEAVRAQPVPAGERPHILAFVPPMTGGLLPRLRAELEMAGFDLKLAVDARWPPSRDEMEQLTRRDAAVAALAFIPNEGHSAIEIWVVDRVTGKTVVRVFSAATPGHGDEAELLAISAVETLRATLMEIDLPQAVHGEIVPPPPAVRALVGAEPHRFAARLGPAIGYDRGGLGGTGQLAVGLTAALGRRLRVGLDGVLPLTSAGVSGPEGQADVRLWLAGAFVEVSVGDPAARGALSVGAGIWAAALRMRGNAAPPYMGVAASITTVAPHGDLVFRWRLGRQIGLGAVLSVALAVPEAVVRFSDRDVATWGRPFGLAALVVEARLD